jgi:uncharacterized protein YndB with AHSA1/START domain/predicted SnoaL-like aldol condensation-catalyzing enzyme
MTSETRSEKRVVVTHRFGASAERVFDAWLDPERAGTWLFATATGTMAKVEIDARVGGTYRFVDRRDGEDVEHVGRYLEIDRPRRLVFTLAVPKYSAVETRVVIDIRPLEAGCELTLTHDGVPADYEHQTATGWTGILDRLVARGTRKDAAVAFLRMAGTGKVRAAYDAYVGDGFRHHNPFFRSDAASLRAGMEDAAKAHPTQTIDVRHAVEDGDLVACHSHVVPTPGDRGIVVCHLFRFAGDKVVELWDVAMEVPEKMPNERGMV